MFVFQSTSGSNGVISIQKSNVSLYRSINISYRIMHPYIVRFQMFRERAGLVRYGGGRGAAPLPGALPAAGRGAEDRAAGRGLRAPLLRLQYRLCAASAHAGHGMEL